jgi:hypothetical protein
MNINDIPMVQLLGGPVFFKHGAHGVSKAHDSKTNPGAGLLCISSRHDSRVFDDDGGRIGLTCGA